MIAEGRKKLKGLVLLRALSHTTKKNYVLTEKSKSKHRNIMLIVEHYRIPRGKETQWEMN